MPIGIQRLNTKRSHPNDRIVFIKPLKGPDEHIAQDFLERIAAQCLPIMKEHHLSVMTLEEYEPNPEFLGRNFNSGEVIQLVLKARSGRWLSFNSVQMVMMHELAHCSQMNHSRAFWDVRNKYAEQMEQLWQRRYTGEGLWGRGALLETGEFERNMVRPGESLPGHLCGGTYRSRRRKRKAKETLTYKEQKERRILKKFGANGVALGDDEVAKRRLENGRINSAAPRVAGSKRGRELRAAAALARFDRQKLDESSKGKHEKSEEDQESREIKEEDIETASEDSDDYDDADAGRSDAVDLDGGKLLDRNGRVMVKVCEDEDPEDQDAKNELLELQSSMRTPRRTFERATSAQSQPVLKQEPKRASQHKEHARGSTPSQAPASIGRPLSSVGSEERGPIATTSSLPESNSSARGVCTVCSFANEALCTTCGMCANVLDPAKVSNSWSCKSQSCQGSPYINAGDCGICGVCGQRRDDS